jgi:cobalamin-dependent methionine synthase I
VKRPLLIAQNLNSSDPAVAAAIAAGDAVWIRDVARRIEATGVDYIDCNAGIWPDRERALLGWMADVLEPYVGARLSLDSASAEVLVEVSRHRARPVLLNSVDLEVRPEGAVLRSLAGTQNAVVISLRHGSLLPATADERKHWSLAALDAWLEAGLGPSQIFVDAIALPWGDDTIAGRPMLDFVADLAKSHPEIRSLVGLSNIGHGHPDAVRIHREWWARLRDVGIGAVILDAFEEGLRSNLFPPA